MMETEKYHECARSVARTASLFAALLLFPTLASAATIPNEVKQLIGKIITNVLNPIIILMFAIALAVFAFGVVRYVWQPENEEERSKGRTSMFWGVIGMFVMVSVFGILRLIINTFGIDPAVLDNV